MRFEFKGWSSLDWLTVCFSSFILMFKLTFSEGTSVLNFQLSFHQQLWMDVPELGVFERSTDTAKYGSVSSSLHIFWVFLMVWIPSSTNLLHWENSRLEVLSTKSHSLEDFLNSYELYCGPLSQNPYWYAVLCKYISHAGNHCIWGGIWLLG